MGAERTVEVSAGHAREARRFITETLDSWQVGEFARGAVMVGHELVANALCHGAPPTLLRLVRRHDSVLIEVGDASSTVPRIAEIDNSTSTSGRGLRIVTSLARAWGVRLHQGGKTVWAEISAVRADARAETTA